MYKHHGKIDPEFFYSKCWTDMCMRVGPHHQVQRVGAFPLLLVPAPAGAKQRALKLCSIRQNFHTDFLVGQIYLAHSLSSFLRNHLREHLMVRGRRDLGCSATAFAGRLRWYVPVHLLLDLPYRAASVRGEDKPPALGGQCRRRGSPELVPRERGLGRGER